MTDENDEIVSRATALTDTIMAAVPEVTCDRIIMPRSPLGGADAPDAGIRMEHADGDALRYRITFDQRLGHALLLTTAVTILNARTQDTFGDFHHAPVTIESLLCIARAWAAHTDRPSRYRAVAAAINESTEPSADGRSAVRSAYTATRLFHRRGVLGGPGSDYITGRYPTERDGRFRAGEYLEPYPGAWPSIPVVRWAASGDLAHLWPYLGEDML